MIDLIGKKLGKWTIEREIGRGGMGRVFQAHDVLPPGADDGATLQYAAIKVLAADLAQEEGFLERFQREIEVLRQLNNPHIVRFYDSGYEDGHYYYAMEYLSGRNFDDLLREKGPFPWKEVLTIALQVCPALKHAHDHGIIHRDIKTQNLFYTDDDIVKLMDFGIAKVFAGKQLTVTGGLVGTAEFLSPEQAAGKPVTHRSDLYSFGVVLYTLLTGRPPFEGRSTLDLMHKHRFAQFDSPQRLVPEIPYDLDKIVCELMEKEPGKRPANALVLLRQLETLQNKVKRREQHTVVSSKDGKTGEAEAKGSAGKLRSLPGPGTLMSQLIREDIAGQKRMNPLVRFLNQPLVLLALFFVCVGIIIWGIWFRPRDSEPVSDNLRTVSRVEYLYIQALTMAKLGDKIGARQRLQYLVDAFLEVPTAEEWVNKAHARLSEMKDVPKIEHRWVQVEQALAQARSKSNPEEAEKIWHALEELYRNDSSADHILAEIKRDRKNKNEPNETRQNP